MLFYRRVVLFDPYSRGEFGRAEITEELLIISTGTSFQSSRWRRCTGSALCVPNTSGEGLAMVREGLADNLSLAGPCPARTIDVVG